MTDEILPRLVAENQQVYILKGTEIRIGRATDNNIVLDSGRCSRYHALIKFSGAMVSVRDLGSTHGTKVNGRDIKSDVFLNHGDRLEFANIIFRFEDPAPTEPRGPSSRSTVKIDYRTMKVTREKKGKAQSIQLNGNAWKLFEYLYNKAGNICTRLEIAQFLYEPELQDSQEYNNSIEQLIKFLRNKLDLKSDTAPCIVTIRGVGYRLDLY